MQTDPYILAFTMAGLGVAAGLYSLLAIWAGCAEWPAWPWRVGAMFVAVAALFPLEAYEPAVLFLMAMPTITLASALIAWQGRGTGERDGEPRPNWSLRFSLRDLLLALVFAGVGSGMFATLWREEAFAHWRGLVIQATGLSLLAVSVVLITVWPRLAWSTLLFTLWSVALPIVVVEFFKLDGIELLELKNEGLGGLSNNVYWIIAYTAFLVVLSSLLLAKLAVYEPSKKSTRLVRLIRIAARSGLLLVASIVLVSAVFVYAQMLIRAPLPGDEYPGQNSYPRILKLANQAHILNPSCIAIVEFESPPDAELAKQLAQIYAEIQGLLLQEGHNEFALPDNGQAVFRPPTADARYLVRSWADEAKQAVASGRLERGAEYVMTSMRLGNMMQRGGTFTDALNGISLEGMGATEFAKFRRDLPREHVPEILSSLWSIELLREDIEHTVAREKIYLDRAYTWQRRLTVAICRLTGRNDTLSLESLVRRAFHRRDATLRMNILDLAIRLYREQHGRLPDSLQDLTPDILPTLPIDPYSGRQFVYRREANGYLLYSVGVDGVDNGGNLRTSKIPETQDGFDFDLDYRERISQPAQDNPPNNAP